MATGPDEVGVAGWPMPMVGYECDYCDGSFQDVTLLRAHRWKVHSISQTNQRPTNVAPIINQSPLHEEHTQLSTEAQMPEQPETDVIPKVEPTEEEESFQVYEVQGDGSLQCVSSIDNDSYMEDALPDFMDPYSNYIAASPEWKGDSFRLTNSRFLKIVDERQRPDSGSETEGYEELEEDGAENSTADSCHGDDNGTTASSDSGVGLSNSSHVLPPNSETDLSPPKCRKREFITGPPVFLRVEKRAPLSLEKVAVKPKPNLSWSRLSSIRKKQVEQYEPKHLQTERRTSESLPVSGPCSDTESDNSGLPNGVLATPVSSSSNSCAKLLHNSSSNNIKPLYKKRSNKRKTHLSLPRKRRSRKLIHTAKIPPSSSHSMSHIASGFIGASSVACTMTKPLESDEPLNLSVYRRDGNDPPAAGEVSAGSSKLLPLKKDLKKARKITSKKRPKISEKNGYHGGMGKKHKCSYCEKSYHLLWHCALHESTHTGSSQASCRLCEFNAVFPSDLETHYRRRHSLNAITAKQMASAKDIPVTDDDDWHESLPDLISDIPEDSKLTVMDTSSLESNTAMITTNVPGPSARPQSKISRKKSTKRNGKVTDCLSVEKQPADDNTDCQNKSNILEFEDMLEVANVAGVLESDVVSDNSVSFLNNDVENSLNKSVSPTSGAFSAEPPVADKEVGVWEVAGGKAGSIFKAPVTTCGDDEWRKLKLRRLSSTESSKCLPVSAEKSAMSQNYNGLKMSYTRGSDKLVMSQDDSSLKMSCAGVNFEPVVGMSQDSNNLEESCAGGMRTKTNAEALSRLQEIKLKRDIILSSTVNEESTVAVRCENKHRSSKSRKKKRLFTVRKRKRWIPKEGNKSLTVCSAISATVAPSQLLSQDTKLMEHSPEDEQLPLLDAEVSKIVYPSINDRSHSYCRLKNTLLGNNRSGVSSLPPPCSDSALTENHKLNDLSAKQNEGNLFRRDSVVGTDEPFSQINELCDIVGSQMIPTAEDTLTPGYDEKVGTTETPHPSCSQNHASGTMYKAMEKQPPHHLDSMIAGHTAPSLPTKLSEPMALVYKQPPLLPTRLPRPPPLIPITCEPLALQPDKFSGRRTFLDVFSELGSRFHTDPPNPTESWSVKQESPPPTPVSESSSKVSCSVPPLCTTTVKHRSVWDTFLPSSNLYEQNQ